MDKSARITKSQSKSWTGRERGKESERPSAEQMKQMENGNQKIS